MKKIALTLIACIIAVNSFAQEHTAASDSIDVNKLLGLLETLAKDQTCTAAGYGKDKPTYELFKTQNMWTFLKLNTKNGIIKQIQYAIKSDEYPYEVGLNFVPLATGENAVSGRFTLYPTENMWTFIMVDQIDGRLWQVQWSQNAKERGIIPFD